MVTPGKNAAANARPAPSNPYPSSAPKPPPTAAAGIAREPNPASAMTGRMSLMKGPGSLKQKLKQEIAMLKKQKQLKKLQKEAEERRRKMMAEKEEKDRERQILFARMEEERKQKQAEREKIQAMRLQEQQRKQQERLIQEEIRKQRDEELWQQQKRQAEFKYQEELQVWKYKHQQWLQQQQQLMAQHGYPYYHGVPQMNSFPAGYPYGQPHPFHQGSHFSVMHGYVGMPATLPPPPPPLPPMFDRNPTHTSVASYVPRQTSSTTPHHPHTSRLCEPLQHPSPFALQGRHLVTVTLVRNPQTQPSYGVNLILHKVSALVDPDWLEAQEKKELTSKTACHDSEASDPAKIPVMDGKINSGGSLKPGEMSPSKAAMADSAADEVNSTPKQNADDIPPPSAGKSTEPSTDVPSLSSSVEGLQQKAAVSSKSITSFHGGVKTEQSNTDLTDAIVPMVDAANDTDSMTMSRDKLAVTTNECAAIELNAAIKTPEDQTNIPVTQQSLAIISETDASTNKSDATALHSTVSTDLVTKKRRRRVNFAVMLVREAEKQNSRQPHISSDFKLQAGDIVIAIGDQDLSGMMFADACKVFASKAVTVSDHLIRTKVVVARQKKSSISTNTISSSSGARPFPVSAIPAYPKEGTFPLPTNESMDFTPSEIALLANNMHAGFNARNRMLGKAIPDDVWNQVASIFKTVSQLKNPAITNRSSDTLRKKWQQITQMKDISIADKARQFWAGKLREQFGENNSLFASYVEVHALRQAARVGPRPAKGCRCGREDHEYLYDNECHLYADIRKRLSAEELEELLPSKDIKGKLSSMEKKALNAVNTANKTRILKLKELNKKEEAEDRFVMKMEEIQAKELKKAIHAPHLSSIVLSAISELQREFPLPKEEEQPSDEEEDADDEDELDEDDYAPLVSLGKRDAQATEAVSKKQKVLHAADNPTISLQYLMRLLEYVSKTWGHCYREPSQLDYAWRWELFHGTYSSDHQWDAKSVCPRLVNSLPFENIQIGLTASMSMRQDVSSLPHRIKHFEDSLLSRALQAAGGQVTPSETTDNQPSADATDAGHRPHVTTPKPSSLSNDHALAMTDGLSLTPDVLDQFCLAVHYLSPSGTGLYEEILALLKMEVVKVRSGIPVFTHNWYEKVDILVLDDLGTYWSSDLDPEGKYCINEELRDTLEERWVKYSYGWALADAPKELIFEYGVMDEWKETFEERLEENENQSEGIGRFGL
jgi:hypothetical protein